MFYFHIISHGLTFWNIQLKSSYKLALLEKIIPLCDLCKSCMTSHGANCQKTPETSQVRLTPHKNQWLCSANKFCFDERFDVKVRC